MSKFLAAVYFIILMLPMIIAIPFIIYGLYADMEIIISTEASKENMGIIFIIVMCFIFSVPMIVPHFNFIFKKLPWLYAYVIFALLDVLLMSVGISIINYGYEVKNTQRHFLFLTFMIVWMVVGRLSICLYYKYKPMKYEGDEDNV